MRIEDTDLLAYVDGHLPKTRKAEVETVMAASSDVAARLGAMRASALPYATAFDAQVLPPPPPKLSQFLDDLLSAQARPGRRHGSSWPRLVATFAAGALCCATVLKLLPSAAPIRADATRVSPWVTAVAEYQQLYSRATVENVTEDSALSAHVLHNLRVDDGITVGVPDLHSAALTFKRVQRLSFHERPVMQMVYLPEHGEPIALCVTPDARPDDPPHAQQIGEMNTVMWHHDRLGYVLLGRVPTQVLLDLERRIASGNSGRLYGRNTIPVPRAA